MSASRHATDVPPSAPGLAVRGVFSTLFGDTLAGAPVQVFTLVNAQGATLRVLDYGGRITSLSVPDRRGVFGDVVLGFDTLADYLQDRAYMGALIGRYANRIAHGRFTLGGAAFELPCNAGPHHLHGGLRGFDKVVWQAEGFTTEAGVGLVLSHTSPAGEEGYPGTLHARATYTLTDANALVCDYHATTDAPTPVSLTQHAYFNLAGDGDILGHRVQINATHFTPTDADQIPTGAVCPVQDTPFDFTAPTPIGSRIDAAHPQLRFGEGYDHNFVLQHATPPPAEPVLAARVYAPATGRQMQVYTTAPGLQFYTGNRLGGQVGKRGAVYGPRTGFCLETQAFPDAPNQPAFPSAIVRPGQPYRSQTVFVFDGPSL